MDWGSKRVITADAVDGQVRGNHDKTREFLGATSKFCGPCFVQMRAWGPRAGGWWSWSWALEAFHSEFLSCQWWVLWSGFKALKRWLVQQRYQDNYFPHPKSSQNTGERYQFTPNACTARTSCYDDRWLEFLCACVFVVLGSFGLFVNEVCVQHDIYRDTCARLGEPGSDRILFKILVTFPISQNTPYKEPNHSQMLRIYEICIYLVFFYYSISPKFMVKIWVHIPYIWSISQLGGTQPPSLWHPLRGGKIV